MNSRKYINNPESLLKEGRAIMSASDDSKYLFRVFAVNMFFSGCTAVNVAKMGGVSKVSVLNWVKSVD